MIMLLRKRTSRVRKSQPAIFALNLLAGVFSTRMKPHCKRNKSGYLVKQVYKKATNQLSVPFVMVRQHYSITRSNSYFSCFI